MSEQAPLTCHRCGHDEFVVRKTWSEKRLGKWSFEMRGDIAVLVQLEDTKRLLQPRPEIKRACLNCGRSMVGADDWRPLVVVSEDDE